MCLGELAEVTQVNESGTAEVRSGGRTKTVSLVTLEALVVPGDWVVIHSGFVLERISAAEAHEAALIRATSRGEGVFKVANQAASTMAAKDASSRDGAAMDSPGSGGAVEV